MLANQIDETEFYQIIDEVFFCCGESQFVHYCKEHTEIMGCYFCQFNYTRNCEDQH